MQVKHFTPRWSEDLENEKRPGAHARVVRDDKGKLQFLLALPVRGQAKRAAYSFEIRVGSAEINQLTQNMIIGLRKLGPGVWTTFPSVQGGDDFHAFITLVDAPEPAPWEAQAEDVPPSSRPPLVSV